MQESDERSRVIAVKNLGRPRGRPRAFDRDEALAKAAGTFWLLGYEGASIVDLTEAMGITPQSLYAAFSSKAELYREALDWYQRTAGGYGARALAEEADVFAGLQRVLDESVREFTRPDRPRGCMVSLATLRWAAEHEAVARYASGMRRATEARVQSRIERGIQEGQLRGGTDPAALARFVCAIIQGMSVQAQDGADEAALSGIARLAMSELARHRG